MHHAFEILNDGVKSLSYGVKPLRDQSETNIVILINISTSLDRDRNFFIRYASCFTVKGESSNIMISMHCYYQSLFKSFDSSDERNKQHVLIV